MSRSNSINSLDTFEEDTDCELECATELQNLRSEAEKIAAAVKNLKNYQPTTIKKVGRPKKNSSPTKNQPTNPDPIQAILSSIVQFQNNLLDRISSIDNRNQQLNKQLSTLQKTSNSRHNSNQPLYSAIASTGTQPSEPHIQTINTKLDQIEQSSLEKVVKLDGEEAAKLAEKIKKRELNDAKGRVVELLRTVEGELTEDCVASVKAIGGEKKHLKVTLKDFKNKRILFKKFKTEKPSNFYISEYLTKNRALLFFKLKQLKKLDPKLKSVYTFNGNICAKVEGSDKFHYINTIANLNHFKVTVLNSESQT